ncbi:MAG: cyclic nucleotide-binding domain-containing protein [Chloroflexota bacterium]
MEPTQCALFLRKIHLFHDLKDEQLLKVAEKITEVSFDTGGIILEQGTAADSFYIIYSGKVRVFRRRDGREQDLAVLVAGDYVGEMELFSHHGRSANVTALAPSLLLRLSKKDFEELLKQYPSLKPNLEVSIESRKLARTLRFKWLRPDEVVYFLARKHPFFLLRVLIAPALSLLLPVFLFGWGYLAQSTAAAAFGGAALLGILGWGTWNAIDWGNDYYVVTNQRVVWMEKIIGMYDSRTEAPLSTILSVGVESDMAGRILDYGNVIVRTFVGAIPFKFVNHPNQAAHMVEEYWNRTKQVSATAEKEAFKTALRQRLGLLEPSKGEPTPPKPEKSPTFPRLYKPNILKIIGANLFKLRFEEGATITYRKHWIVLLHQVGLPSLILAALTGLTAVRLFTLANTPGLAFIQTLPDGSRGMDTIAISLPLLMVPFLGWWLYQYVDWTNDIFRVTNDQIMDIDRKPFGTEERRAAPLDNILSTEYKRTGFVGYVFNFGTVYISVGGTQLAFEDVMDPAGVQSDIDRRRMARIEAKKQAEMTAERSRMADWMAAYHTNVEEFRREQEEKDAKPKSE